MAITFAVRGDSLDARYSSFGKTPGQIVTSTTLVSSVSASGSGIIEDAYLDQDGLPSNFAGLTWPGQTNLPQGKAFSILLRCARKANSDIGLFFIRTPQLTNRNSIRCWYLNSSGFINVSIVNNSLSSLISTTSTSTTMTLDTFHDLVVTCTGDTTANGFKLWKDGSIAYQTTLTGNVWEPFAQPNLNIMLGYAGVETTAIWTNEFVIWDEVIDPTSVMLTSGSGSLNGASRTAFVDVASFDGQLNSAPSAVDVRSGTSYTVEGVGYTGTCAVPEATDVRTGIAVDDTVGSYGEAYVQSDLVNAILNEDVETGYSLKESMRLILSSVAGKLSGAGTSTITIKNVTDTKDRIVATVDGDGNRSAITYDVGD